MFDQNNYRENISWGIMECLKQRNLIGHLTAPLIFGISGGIGIGYNLCDPRETDVVLTVGFRNGWNHKSLFIDKATERLGIEADILSTSSTSKAELWLDEALKQGPCLIWIDAYYINYLKVKQICAGCYGRVVQVVAKKDGNYILNDSGFQFSLTPEQLSMARMAIKNLKNRIWVLDNRQPVDVGKAIRTGIKDCVENMGSNSRSYAIPTLKKWSKSLIDNKSDTGWITMFSNRDKHYLLDCLIQCFLNINIFSDGGGYRYIYSKFLSESSQILNNRHLEQISKDYFRLGGLWAEFSYLALSDQYDSLANLRKLMKTRLTDIGKKGIHIDDAIDFNQKFRLVMNDAKKELEAVNLDTILGQMSESMYVIYEREKEAMEMLETVYQDELTSL
ncbi:DUF4872 domain-containing protein [Clostridia bacterium]|nr:DUF4872 domain-containing protein [Clostridia bacterium]